MVFVLRPTYWTSMTQGLFLRWVQAQGRSPHAPGISKNASDPVGIPLKRGASGAGRYPQPLRRGLKPGGAKARCISSDKTHLNCPSHHGQPHDQLYFLKY